MVSFKNLKFAVKVLPDRSLLIGQKFMGNAKIGKFDCDILGDFQPLWVYKPHQSENNSKIDTFWWENFLVRLGQILIKINKSQYFSYAFF